MGGEKSVKYVNGVFDWIIWILTEKIDVDGGGVGGEIDPTSDQNLLNQT